MSTTRKARAEAKQRVLKLSIDVRNARRARQSFPADSTTSPQRYGEVVHALMSAEKALDAAVDALLASGGAT